MRSPYRLASCLAATLSLALPMEALAAHAHAKAKPTPGQFDYYILSLSWEPGFCATKWVASECGKGKGFTLHGLWPQDEMGIGPENCSGPTLTAAQTKQYGVLFANPSLITHEWSTHGTC